MDKRNEHGWPNWLILGTQQKAAMDNLAQGTFFGVSKDQMAVNGLTLVQSAYHHIQSCPWHYHQNAYFAFTTSGSLLEHYRRRELALTAGSLTYHHSQEPHCNTRYSAYVSALHVDIDPTWFHRIDLPKARPEGVLELHSPDVKISFAKLLGEVKQGGAQQNLAAKSLVVMAFSQMLRLKPYTERQPRWQRTVKELLYAHFDQPMSLTNLAAQLDLHPVYLCQQFPKLFHCSLGEYVRQIKIEKATQRLLAGNIESLTALAYDCGFSDQSHFIRLFKRHTGFTPLAFYKLVQ